jgi:hypothetical protein
MTRNGLTTRVLVAAVRSALIAMALAPIANALIPPQRIRRLRP